MQNRDFSALLSKVGLFFGGQNCISRRRSNARGAAEQRGKARKGRRAVRNGTEGGWGCRRAGGLAGSRRQAGGRGGAATLKNNNV